jgi:hypothetical protein
MFIEVIMLYFCIFPNDIHAADNGVNFQHYLFPFIGYLQTWFAGQLQIILKNGD